ncbi:MAG: Trk system potassium transporter TrkA [Bacilli bacterium]|nr:Trk system potassium transporter TrkA [Bacilli bacterium]
MKIIIIGAGKVGRTVIEFLAKEDHDITVIDTNSKIVNEVVNNYDVKGVVGNGASYNIQIEAEVNKTNLLIATSASDELNILSCLIGKKGGVAHTIARVRNPDYSDQISFINEELGLNLIVNPELEAANEISRILRFPSAIKIDTFSKNQVEIVEMKVAEDSCLVGKSLSTLRVELQITFLICAVERDKEVFIPTGNFQIQANDKIYITASKSDIFRFFKKLGLYKSRSKNIMIIGGSKITYYLSKQLLESNANVKIIEVEEKRAHELSELLPNATIIIGDGSNQSLLYEEGIEKMDAVVTLTGLDEENILISLLSEKLKVPKVITKVAHDPYHDIIESIGLGTVISPKILTASIILRYVRSLANTIDSSVETLYKLVNGKVEAAEFHVSKETAYTNLKLKDLKLKENILIACIIRKNQVIIPSGVDNILPNDNVIVVTVGRLLTDLEDIFR